MQIYGTDVDQAAVMQARRGSYSPNAVEGVPACLLKRYFESTTDGYRWRRDLHCPIIFHHHNLIQTPPLPYIDLLVCRNTLMYLTPEAQIRTLAHFHASLREDGFLLLDRQKT